MPKYNSYSPFEKNFIKNNKNILEKLDNNLHPVIKCPIGSVYDLVNPKPSMSKPCHCLNSDGSYSKKWIYVDGEC